MKSPNQAIFLPNAAILLIHLNIQSTNNSSSFSFQKKKSFEFTKCIRLTCLVVGPPPPPLPPPLKAPSLQTSNYTAAVEMPPMQNDQNGSNESSNTADNDNDSDEIDSDFGLEVIEEPTLRPSELVRGNHNRTMSTISGKLINAIKKERKITCTKLPMVI